MKSRRRLMSRAEELVRALDYGRDRKHAVHAALGPRTEPMKFRRRMVEFHGRLGA